MNCRLIFLTIFFVISQVFGSLPITINKWQHVDPKSEHVFPWFTKPFLDVLSTWEIENWEVFEWGAGFSTIWFGHNCQKVVSVDDSPLWIAAIQRELDELGMDHVVLKHRKGIYPFDIGEGGEESKHVNAIDEDDALYDCIIIDSECHRNACAFHVLNHIKDGGILILDNANQATIGLNSERVFELFKEYEHHSFLQSGHPDWRTDYWIIRKN